MTYNYHAEIINLSQIDKGVFKRFQILKVQKRFLGFVKIYTVAIPEEKIKEAIGAIQSNMSRSLKKEWYAAIHNAERAIIVFRERVFELSAAGITPVNQQLLDTTGAADKTGWEKMICYAKSLGIPDSQCDFLPPDFKERSY